MSVLILLLLISAALGEKQLSLEDIEKDNIQLESNSKDEPASYSAKVEYSQPYAVTPTVHDSTEQQKTVYTASQPDVNYNYEAQTEEYKETKYSENDLTYQQPNNQGRENYEETEKHQFEEPKQSHHQEVIVGNYLQSERQKSVGEKYKNNKDTVYVTVPMDQMYPYHSYLGASQINAKTRAQLLSYDTAAEAPQHVSVPVYTPSFSQKVPYQIQPHYLSYSSSHPVRAYTDAIFPTKAPKNHYMLSKLRPHVSQSYPQYVQQVIYVKPGLGYTQGTPIYNDLYARTPTYPQDNSLYSQAQRSHQVFVSSTMAEQLAKHILQEPQIDSIISHHKKVPLPTTLSLIAPQYRIQKFRSSVTQLHPISSGNEVVTSKHFPALSHEPKSLLDTYIPSYVIAAHDSDRYREKPIKLEGGFLPSKINFIHEYKKRKIE